MTLISHDNLRARMQNDMRLWDKQVRVGGCVVTPPGSLRASRVGARWLQTTNGTKTFSFLTLQSCGLVFFFFFFFCTSASWTWSVNATVLPILSCYAHRQWRTSTFSRCPSSKNFCTGLCMCGVWNGCVLIWLQFFLSVLILAGFDWGYVYAELFWLTLSEK